MTKSTKISSHGQPGPTLFDLVIESARLRSETVPSGSFDIRKQFKAALASDLRHAADEHGREISRASVAARMSDLLGEEITQTTIDNWTAPSHPHNMPADYLPAWVIATGGCRSAVEIISRHSGLFVLPSPDALRAEIQRQDEREKSARAEKLKCRVLLKEVENKSS